jgi:uncharacterized protein (TIGR02452 family)
MENESKVNRKIWKHTKQAASSFEFQKSSKILFSEVAGGGSDLSDSSLSFVVHNHFLEAAESLAKKEYSVLLVINSSPNEPFSALDSGAASDECDLFRRSNYHAATSESLYPIAHDEMIHTPKVTVFKDSDFLKHESPFEIGVLAVAPTNSPEIISISGGDQSQRETFMNDSTKTLTKNKIDAMFKFAETSEYDCLLISNFGGGKFKNPTADLIEMFDSNAASCGIPVVVFSIFEKKKAEKDKEFVMYHRGIKAGRKKKIS